MSDMTDEIPDPENPPNIAADLSTAADRRDEGAESLQHLLHPDDSALE